MRMDLIVVDLHMPGMDGEHLVRLIRAEPQLRNVSIIMVCRPSQEDIRRAKAAGANDYIQRPFEPEALLQKISYLLNVPRRRHLRVLAKLTLEGRAGSEAFYGSTVNISTSGLLLEAERSLAKGDLIHCFFYLPTGRKVEAQAEVVRVVKAPKGFHYGARFTQLSPEARRAIREFVAQKEQF